MQRRKQGKLRCEQVGLAVLRRLPGHDDARHGRQQQFQITAQFALAVLARTQAQLAPYRLVEELAVAGRRELPRIAAEQQRRFESAQADGVERRDDNRTDDAAVTKTGRLELAIEPVAPGTEGEDGGVGFQLTSPLLEQIEQRFSSHIVGKRGERTEYFERLVQPVDPACQRRRLGTQQGRRGFDAVEQSEAQCLRIADVGIEQAAPDTRQTGLDRSIANRRLDRIHGRLALVLTNIREKERRFGQIKQILEIRVTRRRFDQCVDRRRRTRSGKQPTSFVADQHAFAFEQGTHAPRRQAILRNQGDAAQTSVQPGTNLRYRSLRLGFAPRGWHQLQAESVLIGKRARGKALGHRLRTLEQRTLGFERPCGIEHRLYW